MKEQYEIWYKDIDSDTGNIIKDIYLATTYNRNIANNICRALEQYEYEPNREFYIK
jgi:hypothetical protein